MSRINVVKPSVPVHTAEGARAVNVGPEQQLSRLLFTCLLWEDNFYTDGKTVADTIAALVPRCRPAYVAAAAVYARSTLHLRHAPLLVVREMVRHPEHRMLVGKLLPDVIQRPDEIAEFMAIYWKDKPGSPIAKQVKLGLGRAFAKFNEFELAKWDRGDIKLRDVMFLVHAKPPGGTGITKYARSAAKDAGKVLQLNEAEARYYRLAEGQMPIPETWETMLSAGGDKKATFEGLMLDNKLGALAFLRNLRGMKEAGVDRDLIKAYSEKVKLDRVLPYRFIAAARVVPTMEDILEPMMLRAMSSMPKLPGRTLLLIDVSGSMKQPLSENEAQKKARAWAMRNGKAVLPPLNRLDTAKALAILARELMEDVTIYRFNRTAVQVPPRHGFALADAIGSASGGTYLGLTLRTLDSATYDRAIVLTDEQSEDPVGPPVAARGYMINVAAERYGVGFGKWVSISGFSEAVLDYIVRLEEEVVQ